MCTLLCNIVSTMYVYSILCMFCCDNMKVCLKGSDSCVNIVHNNNNVYYIYKHTCTLKKHSTVIHDTLYCRIKIQTSVSVCMFLFSYSQWMDGWMDWTNQLTE